MLAVHGFDWAVHATFGLLLLAMLGAFIRVVRGPGLADRVIALDLLSVTLVAFAAVYALATGETAFLDVSLALALVSFYTTVAFARYLEQRRAPTRPPEEEP
jgi:multicomponent Na+:H+ antiporter subunit F